jgi:CRP-like cAMP-binding protein
VEQQQLARNLEHRPYAQGDFIFRQGELDHFLYFINSGRVDVLVRDEVGNDAYAFSLEHGEIFGEIGLLTGEARGATVKAASALECYVLGKKDISELLINRPEIVDEMTQVMVSRQSALQKARADMADTEEQNSAQHGVKELAARVRHFLGISG